MRQVLVDYARARTRQKRGGGEVITWLDEACVATGLRPLQLLELDECLKRLEKIDARQSQIIEMRFFGGMTAEESSMALSLPVHTVRRELRLAQAWLRKEMAAGDSDDSDDSDRNTLLQNLPQYASPT